MPQIKRNALVGLTLLAGACAGAPPANLVDARAAYQRAAAGPAEALAPAQLHAAQTYLTLAEKTYEDEGNSDNASDRAYVALRKTEIAEVQARIAEATTRAARSEQRGDLAEQKQRTATTVALTQTRAEVAAQKGVIANQSTQLEAETERRKQAELASEQALASLENARQETRGMVITLSGSVIFPSGGSDLLPSARNRLSEVATALSQGEATSAIVVEGHTDSVGNANMNQELSMRRAGAVRDSLVSQGVAANRVSVMGYGATRPVSDNTTNEGRANNRRVEIVVQPTSK